MAREIEFLESPGDHGDEELAAPPRPQRSRLWWLLAVAALVLAGGAFALTRPSSRPSAAPPTTTRTSTTSSLAAVPDHPLGTPSSDAGTSRCGAAPFCAVTFLVPTVLTAALRKYVPRITGLRVETSVAQGLATGASYLADRVIYIQNSTVLMKINVHRLTGPVPAPEVVALGVVQVRRLTEAFVIDVMSYPTAHPGPTATQLRSLARDPRLEVV